MGWAKTRLINLCISPSNILAYASAAELKHGRIAQLAVVGFLLTQYVHLPGAQFQEGPLEALTAVPIAAQAQVFSCES